MLCARSTFFFAVRAGCGTEQKKPEPSVGFNTTRGKTCFVFCFTIPSLSALGAVTYCRNSHSLVIVTVVIMVTACSNPVDAVATLASNPMSFFFLVFEANLLMFINSVFNVIKFLMFF